MEYIIYEDDDIVVVHKPSGIPVQTNRLGQKDLVSMLKNYRAEKKEEPYIGVIHRLDQPVEGLVVFAKTKEAAAKLSRDITEASVDKYYSAIVHCSSEKDLLLGEEVVLEDYLLKDGKTNTSRVVKEGTKDAKKATLRYQIVTKNEKFAKISVKLETGRHHQIRVQMANANLPLVGDKKYGKKEEAVEVGKNIALCSVKLAFLHPKTRQRMEFLIEPKNPTFQLL